MDVKTHFAKSREHWQQMAECAKAAGLDDMVKVCSDRAAHYKAMHSDAVATANKAAIAELEKSRSQVMPTNVSAVTPNVPGVTAVPRAGQKPIETAKQNPLVAEIFGEPSRD